MNSIFPSHYLVKARELINNAKSILVLSHLDSDGLTSGALIGKLLMRMDKIFSIRILKQLENTKDIVDSKADLIIICDMGSGQLTMIKDIIESKKIIILDHHQVQDEFEHENLLHLNPRMHDESISASGVTYSFVDSLDNGLNDLSFLGLIGAIGDAQYNKGFKGFNQELLNVSVNNGIIKKEKGLNVFGRVSRPIHQALSYSFDLVIPGINGNESAAIQFLSDINIELKNSDGTWKTLSNISESEMKKLVSNIIIRRVTHNLDSDILGEVLEISDKSGVLKDLKEWSVLLNACGRQGAYSLGLLLNMGYEDFALPKIEELIQKYKKLLVTSLNFIKQNITEQNNILIVDGKSNISDTIIGTVIGMALNNAEYKEKTIIGFADREDNVKVSCRTKKDINIGKALSNICKKLNCKGGGHKSAGGALIPKSEKNRFIEMFKEEINGETLIKQDFVQRG